MSRVSRAVAACVLAATLSAAAPAAAVPLIEADVTAEAKPKAKSNAKAKRNDVAKSGDALASAEIERIARSVIGTPYSYGGTTPAGFDCSGFTSWVYSHVGITLPHSSSAQYALAGSDGYTLIESMDDLQPGDLVFHDTDGSGIGHVGIYVGNGMFISATSSEGIQERSLTDSYWGPVYVGAVRVSG